MDLFDGHRSKLWRETFNNETTVKGNLCRLTDATDA
jgi:hypothetical protein